MTRGCRAWIAPIGAHDRYLAWVGGGRGWRPGNGMLLASHGSVLTARISWYISPLVNSMPSWSRSTSAIEGVVKGWPLAKRSGIR
jgi:hypothetical protein